MKKTIFLIAVLVLAVGANAVVANAVNQQSTLELLLSKGFDKKGSLTEYGKSLVVSADVVLAGLGFPLKLLIENERATIKIKTMKGNTKIIGISLKKGKISEIMQRAIGNASFEIKISESTINAIIYSKKPAGEITRAINSKEIEISANGWSAKIKKFAIIAALQALETTASATARVSMLTVKWWK